MEYRQKISFFFIRRIAWLLINFIVKTCRLNIIGFEHVQDSRDKNLPIIYVYWHRHIFVTIYRFKKSGARPLISLSKDGELVAQIAEQFGMKPVRGSSSKGGARAFLEMANSIKHNKSEVLITADGPKGPLREVKDGAIRLAQKTGAVIIPIAWHADRVKIFEKTWDKFKIPRFFSRITYAYGSPFIVPIAAKTSNYEDLNIQLKHSIDKLESALENVRNQRAKEEL